MGGLTGTNSTAIYSAKLNSDGTVGTWTTLPVTLPAASTDFSLTESNGYAYLAGGADGNYLDTVYYAALANDGTMGAWTPATNLLPVAEEGASAVAYNNILYMIGGDGASGPAFDTVYYAALGVAPADPGAATANNSPAAGAPDTGHGAPGHDNLLIAVIGTATLFIGVGLWLVRKPKQTM
jgi:N-acetylneuraminic acid mutarotase